MQTVHQQIEANGPHVSASTRSVLHEADSAIAYAEEIRVLRQRVAVLEAELAAAKASQTQTRPVTTPPPLTSIDFAPKVEPAHGASEFTECVAPAVQPASGQSDDPSATDVKPGFAQAWSDENEVTSFEERIAEKAFFQASTIDQGSRSWLLDD